MINVEIQTPTLTSYQKDILECQSRYTVTQACTKAGKTFSHLWWIFDEAHKDIKPGANFWWIAPVYSQAKIAFKRLKRAIDGQYESNETEMSIKIPNGQSIVFKSADNPDNLFGEDVYAAVFDEYTRAKEDAWFALRSTLTYTKGKCKFIGNAKGRGWGYNLYQKGFTGDPSYTSFKVTCWDAIKDGILSEEEVLQAQRDLPEMVFKELYEADPAEDEANPFGYEYIDAAKVQKLSDKATRYYGADIAFKHDWTVIIGLDEDGAMSHYERFQRPLTETESHIKKVVGNDSCVMDASGLGRQMYDNLRLLCPGIRGMVYTGGRGDNSKYKLINGLIVNIQQGDIKILESEVTTELYNFQYTYDASGNVKYNAPSGLHDDCVNALALAVKCKEYAPIYRSIRLGDEIIEA